MKYALFDMSSQSTSFGFLIFCIIVKSQCSAMGEECCIIFKKGPNEGFQEPNTSPYSIAEKKFRMAHMLYPICTLMGLDYSTDILFDIEESDMLPQNPEGCGLEAILKQDREGYPMLWPQPSERAMEIVREEFPEKPFVITLRETCSSDRNSKVEEWIKFAKYVCKTSNVVFVRDTDLCNKTLGPFKTFPLASMDLDIRLALFKHAKINFSVGGGSTNFLRLSNDIPYRTFKYMRPNFSDTGGGHIKRIKEKDLDSPKIQAEMKEKTYAVITREQLRHFMLELKEEGPQKIKLPNNKGGFSIFTLGNPNDKTRTAGSLGYLTAVGFPPGSQFPWHTDNQKIIWEEDDFENLKSEYDRWIEQYG